MDELQGGFADEFGGLSEMSKELILNTALLMAEEIEKMWYVDMPEE